MTTVWVIEERDDERDHWILTSIYATSADADADAERLRAQHADDDLHPEWRVSRWEVRNMARRLRMIDVFQGTTGAEYDAGLTLAAENQARRDRFGAVAAEHNDFLAHRGGRT